MTVAGGDTVHTCRLHDECDLSKHGVCANRNCGQPIFLSGGTTWRHEGSGMTTCAPIYAVPLEEKIDAD